MKKLVLVKDGLGYTEHEAVNIDALVRTMSKALENEGASRARKFEVIEVQVVRRVIVTRETQLSALVSVAEVDAA